MAVALRSSDARRGRAVWWMVVAALAIAGSIGAPPASGVARASDGAVVEEAFTLVLGRPPSATELPAWVATLRASPSRAAFGRHLTLTNTYKRQFIAATYSPDRQRDPCLGPRRRDAA